MRKEVRWSETENSSLPLSSQALACSLYLFPLRIDLRFVLVGRLEGVKRRRRSEEWRWRVARRTSRFLLRHLSSLQQQVKKVLMRRICWPESHRSVLPNVEVEAIAFVRALLLRLPALHTLSGAVHRNHHLRYHLLQRRGQDRRRRCTTSCTRTCS